MSKQNNSRMVITDQEKEWLVLLADGVRAREIAKKYKINNNTFASSLNVLRAKLGCKNMASLIAYSIRNKIIE